MLSANEDLIHQACVGIAACHQVRTDGVDAKFANPGHVVKFEVKKREQEQIKHPQVSAIAPEGHGKGQSLP
jgi:hypothetical protein